MASGLKGFRPPRLEEFPARFCNSGIHGDKQDGQQYIYGDMGMYYPDAGVISKVTHVLGKHRDQPSLYYCTAGAE